ncbi:hypothetical protein [Ruegeria arenilitoris]|uniref:hypothetical protein n=2 Tax=Ruegeria arenilitoris TaxID=1173585 RepID=UPI00147E01CD|nr:hypothetical protein [Ruegeria arenilitoris]
MPTAMVIFTSKKPEDVAKLGGTGWWKVDPVKARGATHVVLTHNAFDKRRPGDPEHHGESFMVATIKDVLQDEDGRWLIQFDQYAMTSAGLKWPGYRNPVNYTDTEIVLDQLEIGDWQKLQEVSFKDAQAIRRRDDASATRMQARQAATSGTGEQTFGEIIELYRERIAVDLGVEPTAVKITIETSK